MKAAVGDLRFSLRLARYITAGKLPNIHYTEGATMIQTMSLMSAGDVARVLMLPCVLLFLVACAALVNRLADKPADRQPTAARPHNAIDTSGYRVPDHAHVVDFERSPMTVLDDGKGTILARCAVSGCSFVVTIGRDVSQMLVEQHEEAR